MSEAISCVACHVVRRNLLTSPSLIGLEVVSKVADPIGHPRSSYSAIAIAFKSQWGKYNLLLQHMFRHEGVNVG